MSLAQFGDRENAANKGPAVTALVGLQPGPKGNPGLQRDWRRFQRGWQKADSISPSQTDEVRLTNAAKTAL